LAALRECGEEGGGALDELQMSSIARHDPTDRSVTPCELAGSLTILYQPLGLLSYKLEGRTSKKGELQGIGKEWRKITSARTEEIRNW